jgi:sec-independent protein translocase protein TatC
VRPLLAGRTAPVRSRSAAVALNVSGDKAVIAKLASLLSKAGVLSRLSRARFGQDGRGTDDMFSDTRMSFGDHLEELRSHLWRALTGFAVGLCLGFFASPTVLDFIKAPVEQQLMQFYRNRVHRFEKQLETGEKTAQLLNEPKSLTIEVKKSDLFNALGIRPPEPAGEGNPDEEWFQLPIRVAPLSWTIGMSEAERLVGKPPLLATMGIMEGFMVYFKVAMVCGVVIGSPWIFYQLWLFVGAGLYSHEKRYVHVYMPFSLFLFLGGVLVCQFLVIPKAVGSLLWFNEWLGFEPDLRLNEWLSFAILLPLVFGLSFQTPLVMLFLAKFGIVDVETFRRKRRIAWFVMAILAGAVTPVDAISMLLLLIPMCALYEFGILLVQYVTRSSKLDTEIPEPEEMVEV